MCYQRAARLSGQTSGRRNRLVARVSCDGVNAGAEQLRRGMAWVSDQDVSDRTLYIAQDIARHAGRGLWLAETPIAPWQWREQQRTLRAKRQLKKEPDNSIFAFFKQLFP